MLLKWGISAKIQKEEKKKKKGKKKEEKQERKKERRNLWMMVTGLTGKNQWGKERKKERRKIWISKTISELLHLEKKGLLLVELMLLKGTRFGGWDC